MSQDINKLIIIGRLVRSPELKSTGNTHFCRFSIANNRSIYNKKNQEKRDEVGYYDVICWGKQAEAVYKYVTKGQRLAIDGRLKWSSWKSADGKTMSKIEIEMVEFQFLDKMENQGDKDRPEPVQSNEVDSDIPF